MREIIFRGKRTDNGEWVEGRLFTDNVIAPKGQVFHIEDNAIIDGEWLDVFPVDPSTVGQYTGLKDKNGKRIFEGDIVQYYGTYALEVYIEDGHTQIRWHDTVTKSQCAELFFGSDEEAYGECEVIGNIHDNPELIGGNE